MTYCIVRFFDRNIFMHSSERETRETGLTLEEAQAYCKSEDSHGDGWFDGYFEEIE